jgi:hypothetical protein
VFEVFKRPRHSAKIDLASVRDTLLYIESDLSQAPQMHRLRNAVRSALQEIERLQPAEVEIAEPKFAAAHFVPAQFES